MTYTEHVFDDVIVLIDDDERTVTTSFPDGRALVAAPNDGPEDVARARALGYNHDESGGDLSDADAVWAMTRDHDLCHTLLAKSRGWVFCPVLYYAAGGPPTHHGDDVERIVLMMQRLMNEGLPR